MLGDRPNATTGFAVVLNNLASHLAHLGVHVSYFGRYGLWRCFNMKCNRLFSGTGEEPCPYCGSAMVTSTGVGVAPTEMTTLQRAGGYEYVPCVIQNTYMLENLHIRRVQKVLSRGRGTKVLGSNGETEILKKFERDYEGLVVTIKGEGLLPFSVTPEHEIKRVKRKFHRRNHESPYYTFSQPDFKPAKFFNERDFLVFPKFKETSGDFEIAMSKYDEKRRGGGKKKKLPKTIKIDEKLMALSGLYLAEGHPMFTSRQHYPKGVIFSFGFHEKKLVDFTVSAIKDIWGLDSKVIHENSCARVQVLSTHLANFFIRSFGCGAKNKKIPTYVMLAPNKLVKKFVVYYLFGDGNERNPKRPHDYKSLRFTTTSVSVALQLQQLLSKINIFAHIQYYEPPKKAIIRGRVCNQSPRYIISISGMQVSKLGFNIEKRRKLNRIGETDKSFFVPVRKTFLSDYSGKVYNFKTVDGTYQVSNVVVHNCEGGVWSERTVSGILEKYHPDAVFTEDDWWSISGILQSVKSHKVPFFLHTPIDSLPVEPKAHLIFKECEKVYVPNSSYRLIKNGVYLPHGVNALAFRPLKRKKLFRKFTFLWIGRDDERKALGRAVLAFKKACVYGDCQLVIRTDWSNPNARKTKAYLKGHPEIPVVLDTMTNCPHEFMANVYGNCHALVISSKAGGFEMQSIEAMACGIPVVCTDWPFMNEQIAHGETGLLVPVSRVHLDPKYRKRMWGAVSIPKLARAMKWMLAHQDEARDMGVRARRHVARKYRWADSAKDLYTSIAEVLGEK